MLQKFLTTCKRRHSTAFCRSAIAEYRVVCSNGRRAQFCRQHKALFTVVVNLSLIHHRIVVI